MFERVHKIGVLVCSYVLVGYWNTLYILETVKIQIVGLLVNSERRGGCSNRGTILEFTFRKWKTH